MTGSSKYLGEPEYIPDHRLSSELILTAAEALLRLARNYLDLLPDDVSPAERKSLSSAARLTDRALDYFQ